MRYTLLLVVLLTGCGAESVTSPEPVAAPVAVSSPAAQAQPTTVEGFSLELAPNGYGRVLVTNSHPWPARLTVRWETLFLGRPIAFEQTQTVPAWSVAGYWPECFFGFAYTISLPGQGVSLSHLYDREHSPAVPVALDKYGVADLCREVLTD